MRTTLNIDDGLLTRAKLAAAESGRTLTAVIEDLLRAGLACREANEAGSVPLPSFRGDGLLPGVDLDDSSALLELMEAGA